MDIKKELDRILCEDKEDLKKIYFLWFNYLKRTEYEGLCKIIRDRGLEDESITKIGEQILSKDSTGDYLIKDMSEKKESLFGIYYDMVRDICQDEKTYQKKMVLTPHKDGLDVIDSYLGEGKWKSTYEDGSEVVITYEDGGRTVNSYEEAWETIWKCYLGPNEWCADGVLESYKILNKSSISPVERIKIGGKTSFIINVLSGTLSLDRYPLDRLFHIDFELGKTKLGRKKLIDDFKKLLNEKIPPNRPMNKYEPRRFPYLSWNISDKNIKDFKRYLDILDETKDKTQEEIAEKLFKDDQADMIDSGDLDNIEDPTDIESKTSRVGTEKNRAMNILNNVEKGIFPGVISE